MRPSLEAWGLALAAVVATRGTCARRRVGCVLLDARGHVLATGYNGPAAGLPHCENPVVVPMIAVGGDHPPEGGHTAGLLIGGPCRGVSFRSGEGLDACQAIHAEANALLQCHDVGLIATACATTAPCVHCVKLLLNTGCKTIVFTEDYPHADQASRWWRDAGREWRQLP